MRRNHVINGISIILILLFVYTVVRSLLNFNSYKLGIFQSPLIGNNTTNATIISATILIAELWIAVLLLVKGTRLWGLYAASALLMLFTGYLSYLFYTDQIAQIVKKGADYAIYTNGAINYCFAFFKMSWNQHLYFTIFLHVLSLTAIVLRVRQSKKSRERELPPVVFT